MWGGGGGENDTIIKYVGAHMYALSMLIGVAKPNEESPNVTTSVTSLASHLCMVSHKQPPTHTHIIDLPTVRNIVFTTSF